MAGSSKSRKTESSKAQVPWACPICGARHHYDCPSLGPIAFLRAVMHDHTVPIRDRIKAADHLLRLRSKGIVSDHTEPEPAYKVIIPEVTIQ